MLVNIICKQCGESFQAASYLASGSRARIFCSQTCFGKWFSEHRQGKDNLLWKDKITCTCEYCGEVFERLPCEAAAARFCSRSCLAKSRTGKAAANWRGGKSFEPYPIAFNEGFKKRIRSRDGYTCAICRLHGKEVHHIDYIKENTVSDNCITLCRSCHRHTNGDRTYWQRKLETIMKARRRLQLWRIKTLIEELT